MKKSVLPLSSRLIETALTWMNVIDIESSGPAVLCGRDCCKSSSTAMSILLFPRLLLLFFQESEAYGFRTSILFLLHRETS